MVRVPRGCGVIAVDHGARSLDWMCAHHAVLGALRRRVHVLIREVPIRYSAVITVSLETMQLRASQNICKITVK